MTASYTCGLYVPGDRPERFGKALASGADLVVFDLEDGVAADRKVAARAAVTDFLDRRDRAAAGPAIQVRAGDPHLDVAALSTVGGFTWRVPKVESSRDLDPFRSFGNLVALVETARGVLGIEAIAADPAVTALGLGEADLASDLGGTAAGLLDHARARLVYASAAHRLAPPMMSVYPSIDDIDGLIADTKLARSWGFAGRMAIHPTQVAPIQAAFAPTPGELAWARSVLDAPDGASRLPNGDLVDAAMRGRARRIVGNPDDHR